MKRAEIKETLRQCNDLMALIMKGNELKANGENPSMVNRVMTEVRKELVTRGKKVKKITRMDVMLPTLEKMGYLEFAVQNLSKPIVMYNGDAIVI